MKKLIYFFIVNCTLSFSILSSKAQVFSSDALTLIKPKQTYSAPQLQGISIEEHKVVITLKRANETVCNQISYRDVTTDIWACIIQSSAKPVTLSNLSANTNYEVRVIAYYRGGNSSPELGFCFTTEPETIADNDTRINEALTVSNIAK